MARTKSSSRKSSPKRSPNRSPKKKGSPRRVSRRSPGSRCSPRKVGICAKKGKICNYATNRCISSTSTAGKRMQGSPAYFKTSLKSYKLPELRAMARSFGIRGYSGLNRANLITILKEY